MLYGKLAGGHSFVCQHDCCSINIWRWLILFFFSQSLCRCGLLSSFRNAHLTAFVMKGIYGKSIKYPWKNFLENSGAVNNILERAYQNFHKKWIFQLLPQNARTWSSF